MIVILVVSALLCSVAFGQTYSFTYSIYASAGGTCPAVPSSMQTNAQSGQCFSSSLLFGAAGGSGGTKINVAGSTATIQIFTAADCSGTPSTLPTLTNGVCFQDSNKDIKLTWAVAGSTVWSGIYQVGSSCASGCCCVNGQFTVFQTGSQISSTLGLTGTCGGTTFVPQVVNLASSTATTFSVTILGQTLNVAKNGAAVTLTNSAASQCSGSATCTSGDCRSSTSSSTTCFHESTVISYKGKDYPLSSLPKDECRVPHIVTANGLAIEIDCDKSQKNTLLRLTPDHLVFGSKGLVPASSLSVGDIVFSDLEEKEEGSSCRVKSIAHESGERYFGLNCRESVVLANGIKTSTFGRYHTIPSLWMKCISAIFGVERASLIGDWIASSLAKMQAL